MSQERCHQERKKKIKNYSKQFCQTKRFVKQSVGIILFFLQYLGGLFWKMIWKRFFSLTFFLFESLPPNVRLPRERGSPPGTSGELRGSLGNFRGSLGNFREPLDCCYPDPPTLAFLKKARVLPQKNKGFSLRGTPKILGKGRKAHKKSKENRKQKKQGNRKKQGLEGQGKFHSDRTSGEVAEKLPGKFGSEADFPLRGSQSCCP